MKRQHTTFAFFLALLAMMMMTGCNSDGDETIVLEYGSAKKMIVGRWKLGEIYRIVNGTRAYGDSYGHWRPGVVLVFYSDGTYTDSSDGGSGRHHWQLGPDYKDGEPYYGGITLDDDDYGIDYLGPDHWVLIPGGGGGGYDDNDNGRWHLGWDSDDDDDEPAPQPDPDPEPEPEPEPISHLVKKVVKTNAYGYTNTWEFTYDDEERVTTMKTDYFTFSFSYPSATRINVSGYGNGITATLDSKGRITSVIANGSNMTASYGYDSSGYLTEANTPWYSFSVAFKGGELSNVQLQRSNYTSYSMTNYSYESSYAKNDANIDLNCFLISPIFSNGIVDNMLLFEPFDLFGKRTATLSLTEWIDSKISFSHLSCYRDDYQRIVKLTNISGTALDANTIIDITYY